VFAGQWQNGRYRVPENCHPPAGFQTIPATPASFGIDEPNVYLNVPLCVPYPGCIAVKI
jgi:hypothetical protein